MAKQTTLQKGYIDPLIFVVIALSIVVLGLGYFGFWSYTNYLDQKNNVDHIVANAVAQAKAEQAGTDTAAYEQKAKSPTLLFSGPSDLGSIKFNYPRTWSGYIGSDGSSGDYEAYFDPGMVPPVNAQNQYALRVSVVSQPYDSILASFTNGISNGQIKATTVNYGGESGVRLDGAIETNIIGSMIIMKIRSQTLELFTESKNYQSDFDSIVAPSLSFVQ